MTLRLSARLDFQTRGRDYRLLDIPGYMEWSERKLAEGELAAFIAHVDATSCWILPEEVEKFTEKDFDDMLEEVKMALKK